ncbi:MAG: hypothetical protein U0457_02690 [Candidatus Sericytochromatia bacterium]
MSKIIINRFSKKIREIIQDIISFPDNEIFYTQEYVSSIRSDTFKIDFDVHNKKNNEVVFTFTIKFIIEEKTCEISSRYNGKNGIKSKQIASISDILNFDHDKDLQKKVLDLIYNEFDSKIKEARIPFKYDPL